VVTRSIDNVYNFVLDRGHVLEVNGVAGVTLAHGSKDCVLAHPFWGTSAVVCALKTGLALGHVSGPWPSLHCGAKFYNLLFSHDAPRLYAKFYNLLFSDVPRLCKFKPVGSYYSDASCVH